MFDPYTDYQRKEKVRREEERELRARGLWDSRFNPRQAPTLPQWVTSTGRAEEC